MFCYQILNLILLINVVLGGVLILSPKKTEVSGLKPFDRDSFRILKDSAKKAKIISFKINSERIPDECEHLIQTKYTAYVPNAEYIPENTIILNKSDKQNCNEIKKKIRTLDLDNQKNIIYLIIHESLKVKRNAEFISTTTDSSFSSTTEDSSASTTANAERLGAKEKSSKERSFVDPDAPVLYEYKEQALLYSSKAPVLKVQNDTITFLGPATIVTYDNRDTYIRMSCTIPVDDGKVTLRFRFPWESGYWYLKSVTVETDVKINLTITRDVSAPREFSHSCGGETIFTDGSSSLTLFDLQVQPQTKGRRFSDAYNCVPFMTGPIWSGIFVTTILAIGLIIGLSALGSIKTMDKFDNSKTKQLTITVMGE